MRHVGKAGSQDILKGSSYRFLFLGRETVRIRGRETLCLANPDQFGH